MAESIGGGYDYIFITDLPEDLVCTLCHLAFKNPLQIEECGHTFCKLCFDQMVDHAESNFCLHKVNGKRRRSINITDITCPLDRQKIDIARVFKDKSCERRVLNLMVKCPNFADDCDWTGELREALVHETECCKNKTMLNRSMDEKLNQLFNRMAELETNAKSYGLKLSEKEKQIEYLLTQMENQNRTTVNQSKQMEAQAKQIENLIRQMEDQNKQIKDQNKQIYNQSKQIEDQNKQIGNQKKQIEDQNKQMEDQNKQMEYQNKQIKDQNKQIYNQSKQIEDQNKQIGNQKKQMEDQNKQMKDQNKQIDNQSKQMEDKAKQIDNLVQQLNATHQYQNNMIIKNIEDESNYSPICTAFQWKFKPGEIRSGDRKFSPPFYNVMNAHCFQLSVEFLDDRRFRYRGKYDHHSNAIKITKDIDFEIRIFGKNGKLKVLQYCTADYPIINYQMKSTGRYKTINNGEIGSLTIDGYVNLHCFFNKTI